MDEGEPLLDEVHDDFTIRKDYGVLYMGYPTCRKTFSRIVFRQ